MDQPEQKPDPQDTRSSVFGNYQSPEITGIPMRYLQSHHNMSHPGTRLVTLAKRSPQPASRTKQSARNMQKASRKRNRTKKGGED